MSTLEELFDRHTDEASEKAYRMYRNQYRRDGQKALVAAIKKYGTMGTRVERRLLRLRSYRTWR